MEPTGVMDNKREQLDMNTAVIHGGEFTICDLGDEEVHFSRHSSDYYYYHDNERNFSSLSEQHFRQQQAQPAHASKSSTGPLPPESHNKMARKSSTRSVPESGQFRGDAYHPYNNPSNEQISSSRLLNSLGNKLRRGSNYLNAPTKLLGQYLLGITIQSWSEFFNTSRMMKVPGNRHQLTRRLITNLSHFQGNYLCVSLILVIYCILTSPLLLIAIAAYLLTLYLVTARSALGKQTRVFGYRLNLQQQYSFITMLSLPPLWIAGAPSAVFWVIGASFFVVGLHASMFANERPVTEQQLVGPARANHPLVIPAPIHYLGQQGYIQLDAQQGAVLTAAQSNAQYYNHYPGVAKGGYIPVALSSQAKIANNVPTQPTGESGGYMSSAISHWIPFAGGRSSSGRVVAAPTTSDVQPHDKTPDVKIISRDYAGLGRVYEV